jgi:hypothetical protein
MVTVRGGGDKDKIAAVGFNVMRQNGVESASEENTGQRRNYNGATKRKRMAHIFTAPTAVAASNKVAMVDGKRERRCARQMERSEKSNAELERVRCILLL